MSVLGAVAAGRAAAERLMTDTWTVTRVTGVSDPDETTGVVTDTTSTIYTGPAKLASFESYEQTPEAVGNEATVMRPHFHVPLNATTGLIRVDDIATCTASVSDAALVGRKVRISGDPIKSHATARRFPVELVAL